VVKNTLFHLHLIKLTKLLHAGGLARPLVAAGDEAHGKDAGNLIISGQGASGVDAAQLLLQLNAGALVNREQHNLRLSQHAASLGVLAGRLAAEASNLGAAQGADNGNTKALGRVHDAAGKKAASTGERGQLCNRNDLVAAVLQFDIIRGNVVRKTSLSSGSHFSLLGSKICENNEVM
jgi:hypothetical protein